MKLTILSQNKVTAFIAVLVITSLLVLLSTQAIANMFGFLKKYDVHLCPEVHGRVLLKGKPLGNIEVFRSLTYGDDDEVLNKTLTDKEGRFSFDAVNIRSKKPGSMFDESSIRQVIDLDYKKENYLLWGGLVSEIKPNKLITDKLSKLLCDISSEEKYFEFTSSDEDHLVLGIQSICRW